MSFFKPAMYKKNIHEIDYIKLKDNGIKCLIFDLDNTLGLIENRKCPKKTKELINKLKEDFLIFICSNNRKKRLEPYMKDLGIGGVAWSMKPLTRGLRKIKKENKLLKKEMCIIGDQIVTDIFSGKKFNIMTVLVDPLGEKDLKITALNRIIENYIVKKYSKKKIFERGKYYD